ncbi:MAG: hypothetical protein ACLU38_01380 [Dysosmobacter sp.]
MEVPHKTQEVGPSRHQIALAVALLGISSMLCLELMKKVGRRLEEQQQKLNEE